MLTSSHTFSYGMFINLQMLLSFLYFTSILTVARETGGPSPGKPSSSTTGGAGGGGGSIAQVPSVVRLRRHSLSSMISRQSLSERTINMSGDSEWNSILSSFLRLTQWYSLLFISTCSGVAVFQL